MHGKLQLVSWMFEPSIIFPISGSIFEYLLTEMERSEYQTPLLIGYLSFPMIRIYQWDSLFLNLWMVQNLRFYSSGEDSKQKQIGEFQTNFSWTVASQVLKQQECTPAFTSNAPAIMVKSRGIPVWLQVVEIHMHVDPPKKQSWPFKHENDLKFLSTIQQISVPNWYYGILILESIGPLVRPGSMSRCHVGRLTQVQWSLPWNDARPSNWLCIKTQSTLAAHRTIKKQQTSDKHHPQVCKPYRFRSVDKISWCWYSSLAWFTQSPMVQHGNNLCLQLFNHGSQDSLSCCYKQWREKSHKAGWFRSCLGIPKENSLQNQFIF